MEYALNEGHNKITFVGYSIWVWDASKMNRPKFLSIPDLNEKDSKNKAFIIGQSYDKGFAEKYQNYYENLGLIYLNIKIFWTRA